MNKIRVGVLFGGKSAEHEISVQSAKNVIAAIDKNKYEIFPIGIDKSGKWHLLTFPQFLSHFKSSKILSFFPEDLSEKPKNIITMPGDFESQLDIIFPVLHGPLGEDGTVQGMLRLLDIPFVGASVLGSAVGMDKDVSKRLIQAAGIPTAKFLTLSTTISISFEDVVKKVGLPFFVKPANLGSSVAIHKVKSKQDYQDAIEDAFSYDHKILIEESIEGREIECSVLGNEHPIASLPGEIVPHHEFYSYEAKYLDDHGADFHLPAKLDLDVVSQVQHLAVQAFKVCCCEGMARVDFFVRENQVLFNEINTIPGFTSISMYPKMWEVSGLSFACLIDRLIELGLERAKRQKQFLTNFSLPHPVS